MSKPGSVRCLNKGLVLFFFVIGLGAACAPSETPAAVPTWTLIPATIADTPSPVPPTTTPPALSGPEDIPAAQALIPAAAQPLVSSVMDDLAATLEAERSEIQLVLVEATTWTSADLGCPTGGFPDLEQAIEGYRVILLVADTVYEYHTDSGSSIRRCGQEGSSIGETDVLVEVDPVAAELVALAQRRVSQERDVPASRVRVVEVSPYTWTDSSLGCPLDGEDYTAVEIDGYRIVLAVGDREFIFHTDFDRLIPCDSDDELLPTEEAN